MLQLLQVVDGYELPETYAIAVEPPPKGPETVTIESGEHTIGAPSRGFAYDNERGRHTVVVSAFEIDRTPVSQATYARFAEETGANVASHRRGGVGVEMYVDRDQRSLAQRRPAKICCRWGRSQLRKLGRTTSGCVAHEPPRSTLCSGPKKTSEYSGYGNASKPG